MRILTINTGSSSLKFRVSDVNSDSNEIPNLRHLTDGQIRSIGNRSQCHLVINGKTTVNETRPIGNHSEAVRNVLSWLKEGKCGFEAVGHRIVHGGERYTQATFLNLEVIQNIKALEGLAPLHNPIGLEAIQVCRDWVKPEVPMVAVFDTAFHHTLPPRAFTYAIPYDLAQLYKIRRYGFHGIAHRYLARRYMEITGKPVPGTRLITLQLGHGCSAAAIRDGISIDTTMGFTPLEGLVMATRSGDVDPAVVAFLAEKQRKPVSQVIQSLNDQSGVLGISGKTADMKELLVLEGKDERAKLALDVYCYRLLKCIGAYLTVLSGADGIIFSGGVGEHASSLRERICNGLAWCGIQIDPERNRLAIGKEACISKDSSSSKVYVIPVDEESIIAQETFRCLI
ncbi:MAG TPA: acetate kinase [Nitrospiria bacterium]